MSRTPGQWHAGSFTGSTTHHIFAGSGDTRKAIAQVYEADDAKVMAAAAELAEVLEQALPYLENGVVGRPAFLNRIRAALAKASP